MPGGSSLIAPEPPSVNKAMLLAVAAGATSPRVDVWIGGQRQDDCFLSVVSIVEIERGIVRKCATDGTASECTSKQAVEAICSALDGLLPAGTPHARLITPVTDRPGHDRRYAIDPTRISTELGWQPRYSFEEGLAATVRWYLANQAWLETLRSRSGYSGQRLGLSVPTPHLAAAN